MGTERNHEHCEHVQRLIAERTERTLLGGEQDEVTRHVAACASCRAFLAHHDEALELFVTRCAPATEGLLSDDFTDRLLARLPNLRQAPAAEPAAASPTARSHSETPEIPIRVIAPIAEPGAAPRGGKLRPLFARPAVVLAAASVLLLALLGLLFVHGDAPLGVLDDQANLVARQTASAPAWLPAAGNVPLGDGDAAYVAPGGYARITLADGTALHLAGDTLVRCATAGVEILAGTALVRAGDDATAQVRTPFVGVEVPAEGEALLRVDRPDQSAASAEPARGDASIWARRGTLQVQPLAGGAGGALALAAGESRVFLPDAPPCRLAAVELDELKRDLNALGRRPEPIAWSPEPGRPLAASLAAALDHEAAAIRCLALDTAGRLGLADLVVRGADAAARAGADPAFRRAAVQALVRVRPADAAARLTVFLGDANAGVRNLAARGLGRLGARDAAPALRKLVAQEKSAAVQLAAAGALADLDQPVAATEIDNLVAVERSRDVLRTLEALTPADVGNDPRLLERVGRWMTDRSQPLAVRKRARNLLVDSREPATETWLVNALEDPDTMMRTVAMRALGHDRFRGGPLAAPALDRMRAAAAAPHADARERAAAVFALAHRGAEDRDFFRRLVADPAVPGGARTEAVAGWVRPERTSAEEVERLYARVSAESPPPEALLAELVHRYGTTAVAPRKTWIYNRIDADREQITRKAFWALGATRKRGARLTEEDADVLRLRMAAIRDPALRAQLMTLVVEALPTDGAKLAFLVSQLQSPGHETIKKVCSLLRRLPVDAATPVLRRLLEREDPRVVSAAAGALARYGLAAGSVAPDLRRALARARSTDPSLENPQSLALARALLRVGDGKTAVPLLKNVVAGGGQNAVAVVGDLWDVLGPDSAAPFLLAFRANPDSTVRFTISRAFVADAPQAVMAEVRAWWAGEHDPWTRLALAFTLVETDRAPALEALAAARAQMLPRLRGAMARECRQQSFDVLAARLGDATRPLPSGLRAGIHRFIRHEGVEGRNSLARGVSTAKRGQYVHSGDQLKELAAAAHERVQRVRLLRRGLWSPHPAVRRAAALRARGALHAALIPVLLDKLRDPDPGVRAAAAATLAAVSAEAVAGYRPEASGEALRAAAERVRRAFDRLDLAALLPAAATTRR